MIGRGLVLGSLLALGQVVNPGNGGGVPSGAAGGDLSGTYPNPTVAQSTTATFTTSGLTGLAGVSSTDSRVNIATGAVAAGGDGFGLKVVAPTGASTNWAAGIGSLRFAPSSNARGIFTSDGSAAIFGVSITGDNSTHDLGDSGTYWRRIYVNNISLGPNCSSSASPAVCGAAASGSVTVAAAATTVVVNTTAVTANSQILLTQDSSLGTKLSVTCNTTANLAFVSARTAATSFTITSTAPVTNPLCLSYTIIN